MADEWGSGRRGRRPPPSPPLEETSTSTDTHDEEVEAPPEQVKGRSSDRQKTPHPPMMQHGVPLTNWTDCGRYSLLGLATGAFVGAGAGAVDTFVKVRSRNLTRQGIVQLLMRTVASRGLACSGFFLTYQSILCMMRWKQLNQESEVSNVLVSGAVAFSPFMVAGRGNTFGPYFMLLVAMDAFDQFRDQFER
eukprot:gb/GECG01011118.1/.p1 GENE.gb/GECG01011118.1/~~gb/GECG01011118.1/.p1  ORF type:complete len:192 (+),score=18.67 gb/GECG01011118.1/:1-576(+)